MVISWITQDNLEPFLTVLSWIVGYKIDEDDWQAITTGLLETNGELFRWYDYEFTGSHDLKFKLAVDPGTEVLQVEVETPDELQPQVDLAVAIFQHFRLRQRREKRDKQ